jgi:hypothetical protein
MRASLSRLTKGRNTMPSSAVRALMPTAMLTGLLAIVTAVPAAAAITTSASNDARGGKATAMQYARIQCMTDEGGGRYKPCDAAYRREHPDWRSTDTCMTDEGSGRYKPCSLEYKNKHMKK